MRRAIGTVLLVLAVGLAGACGAKGHRPSIASASGARGAGASPTPSVDPTEALRQFAQCMRDHGVNVADPGTDPGGAGVRMTTSEGPRGGQAMQACQHLLPAGKLQTPGPEDMEKLRQYAQCMREHGIDMPDPDPNAGTVISKSGGPETTHLDPDSPAFQDADKACAGKLPGKRNGGVGTGGGK